LLGPLSLQPGDWSPWVPRTIGSVLTPSAVSLLYAAAPWDVLYGQPSRPALDDVDLDYLDENDTDETKGT
jgi:hypothetical protein